MMVSEIQVIGGRTGTAWDLAKGRHLLLKSSMRNIILNFNCLESSKGKEVLGMRVVEMH